METIHISPMRKYDYRVSHSPVFECALDIAAFTRDSIQDKLVRSIEQSITMREAMTDGLRKEVELSGNVHTWRSLLYLAHRCDLPHQLPASHHAAHFSDWLISQKANLKTLAAPYLGAADEQTLAAALADDQSAQARLLERYGADPVVSKNLEYLFAVTPAALLAHVQALFRGWYEAFWQSEDQLLASLGLSADATRQQMASRDLFDSLRVISNGSELHIPPGTEMIWLVPQISYRPFTIVNYLPQIFVVYYPVANVHMPNSTVEDMVERVAQLHKALGDVQRIRLLRILQTGPKTLAELTDALHATKSNVHHHLTLLRASGLASVSNGLYTINRNNVLQVGDELKELLGE